MNVTNTPGAIINWKGFSIGANEITRFIQEHNASAVLNRVVGANPSQILGQLSSNGQVFLINRNGIVFGAGARVDTAGFVASTLSLSDVDFLAKNFRFEGDASSGSITNQGFIKTAPGGDIVLIAPSITNTGIVHANNGDLILAAGQKVTLASLDLEHISFEVQAAEHKALNLGKLIADQGVVGVFAGQIDQQGDIEANKVTRDAGGVIRLVANGTVEVAGSVKAVGNRGAAGGAVEILGQNVVVHDAVIDVSGETGGGTVLVGGAFQGRGSTPTSRTTEVSNTAAIHADATGIGDGGQIIVWADEATQAHGRFTARGGPLGGDGGLIETSGKRFLDFSQAADVSAPRGKAGTWLLDPEDISIGRGKAAAIEKTLNTGGNVSVTTSDGGTGEGNITVRAPITKTAGADATLSMKAHNRIDVDAPISSKHNRLNVDLKAGASVNINSSVDTNGGSLSTQVTGVMPEPLSTQEPYDPEEQENEGQPGSRGVEDRESVSQDHSPEAGAEPKRGSESAPVTDAPSQGSSEQTMPPQNEPAIALTDSPSEATEIAAAQASDETANQTITAHKIPQHTQQPASGAQPSITVLEPVVTSGGDIRIDAGGDGRVS
ncbi:MAG: filamentous hemagglutinin N-terminal domain-containing protein, partial [Gammaproteobacteria bacterium]|nr:filamentous hemagglutinin N-terminal domain-containing protein [Gammaproteobacteria bacterium]